MSRELTTQRQIAEEISRQQARLTFVSDEVNRRILKQSIADLVELYKDYPQTLWCGKDKNNGK